MYCHYMFPVHVLCKSIVWRTPPPFSTRRVRAHRNRRGAHTDSHRHTHTWWFGLVIWHSLKRLVDRGSREAQGSYSKSGCTHYKLFSLLRLYCIITIKKPCVWQAQSVCVVSVNIFNCEAVCQCVLTSGVLYTSSIFQDMHYMKEINNQLIWSHPMKPNGRRNTEATLENEGEIT